ncbi:MAG: class I SAM-dependent rRNA methyltransferase [Verrucomicrobia bacterium]|nr:MAG: class I SAM-dependent rRNA methyltransferase [Verrucomicrobiota bacterium]
MTINTAIIRLKHGREKPIVQGQPWIFSGAIEKWEGAPAVGAVTDVLAANGEWLARGLANPAVALAVRLYTWQREQALDAEFFAAAVARAVTARRALPGYGEGSDVPTNAWRLIFSEADDLSGLIVDRYADVLAVQIGAAALVPFAAPIVAELRRLTGATTVRVTAAEDEVEREKLAPDIFAKLSDVSAQPVRIRENGLLFDVDLAGGQKTGFFLDQRENRKRVAAWARGRRMLSAYCYTGAFELYAAAAGATEILGLDRSASALEQARAHHVLNKLNVPTMYERADVPEALRRLRDAGKNFDLIVLDPPKFVLNRAQKEKGLRAYKDINLLAMKLLAPGGVLATFSCSGQVTPADFRMMLGWAAADARRPVQLVETLSQPPDHPVLAVFPDSEYLKGAICRVA